MKNSTRKIEKKGKRNQTKNRYAIYKLDLFVYITHQIMTYIPLIPLSMTPAYISLYKLLNLPELF